MSLQRRLDQGEVVISDGASGIDAILLKLEWAAPHRLDPARQGHDH